jgi:hypothetical protein
MLGRQYGYAAAHVRGLRIVTAAAGGTADLDGVPEALGERSVGVLRVAYFASKGALIAPRLVQVVPGPWRSLRGTRPLRPVSCLTMLAWR